VWTKLKIVLSRIDHFFGDGLSSLSFLVPPNPEVCVLDLSVLNNVVVVVFQSRGERGSIFLKKILF
jgi:hypothetical protein